MTRKVHSQREIFDKSLRYISLLLKPWIASACIWDTHRISICFLRNLFENVPVIYHGQEPWVFHYYSLPFPLISLLEILLSTDYYYFLHLELNSKQNVFSHSRSLRCQNSGVISVFLFPAMIIHPCVMCIPCQLDYMWN